MKIAEELLEKALAHLNSRGEKYDTGRERTMPAIVARFEAQTGRRLTVAQGYRFMMCLKEARQAEDPGNPDHIEDWLSYAALYAEALSEENG